MGFCVLHYDKQTGSSPGLAMHIERGILRDGEWVPFTPKSADVSRSHLNRELIDDIKGSRNERIENRIKEAGVKVRKDSVRALTLIMSASTEDMQRISSEGKFDDWCHASIKWAQDTHGKENVVSAVLHMDETTPHLHLTVVPIVKGESKDQAYRKAKEEKKAKEGEEPKKKRKYKKKDPEEFRLCAADVMARGKLRDYQTSYAQAVGEFGLERGIEDSPNSHVDINDWYKDLVKKGNNLKSEITQLKAERDDLTASNALAKAKVEGAVKNTAKGLGEAIASVGKGFGKSIAEMGTYAFPSKARDREMKAKEEAEKYKNRAIEEVNKRREAESERDKAKREKKQFIETYSAEIKHINRNDSLIENLREENTQLKESKQALDDYYQEAERVGISLEDANNLRKTKHSELSAITDKETGDVITRADGQPIKIEYSWGQSRVGENNISHLRLLIGRTFKRLKEWLKDVRTSREFLINGKRNPEQTQQIKSVFRR